ncbi:3-oxoacyl-ACP reductase [Labrys miyagiensis]|jgi:2-dehydro-3-deoxy-L-rhamnonate dehydrogenase (NAD+)|uniref:3-oxoacyl-ACP reductase n=1 Tax=Labrys miyagiensis TaxID=346912 RepID=A0ABQ6CX11_9HYPH|nr:SDR family NAD(P)-dependent oxidoreductase [Labrys miyagiensis]GLS23560.1 3-oxoacyl-ACP reductase [Labrys miyagiensis]
MTPYAGRFKGRCVVITGGASGLGLASARRISAEGGRVLIWDVDAGRIDSAKAQIGAGTFGIVVDVTNPTAVETAAKTSEQHLGQIDALICSAGIAGRNAAVIDYPIDEWKRIFDINVHGLFYANRYVAALMKKRGYGRIVNLASIAGKEGNPTASAYSASKAAVIGFTKALGKELAKTGVTANVIAPATVETPILKQVAQAHIDFMLSKIPMGRFGKVDEIVAMITWLASEECSFATGAVFDASGGRATY